jgi:hypothetical protein
VVENMDSDQPRVQGPVGAGTFLIYFRFRHAFTNMDRITQDRRVCQVQPGPTLVWQSRATTGPRTTPCVSARAYRGVQWFAAV